MRQSCVFGQKHFDTVTQKCHSRHSFCGFVRQNCNSPHNLFDTMIQNCNSFLKIFDTVRQYFRQILTKFWLFETKMWHPFQIFYNWDKNVVHARCFLKLLDRKVIRAAKITVLRDKTWIHFKWFSPQKLRYCETKFGFNIQEVRHCETFLWFWPLNFQHCETKTWSNPQNFRPYDTTLYFAYRKIWHHELI